MHPLKRRTRPKVEYAADFVSQMKELIAKGEHAEYFVELVRQFDHYQKVFAKIFVSPTAENDHSDQVFTFGVGYMGYGGGGDTIVAGREVEIVGRQSFEALARHIILSMGWCNDHMHGFDLVGKKSLPDPLYTGPALTMYADGWEDDPHPTFKTYQIRIADIDYSKQPTFSLMFDYGDGHSFDIVYKSQTKMSRQDTSKDFPRLISSWGVAPEQYPPLPED